MMVRDDYSRFFIKVHFLGSVDDTAEYFIKYLVDIAPRKVEVMRSDRGGGGLKASLVPCVLEKSLHELTTADTLELNGVAERKVALI